MKQISELPDNVFVVSINITAGPPYMEVVPEVSPCAEPEQFEIPECLAYYLRTHWRGTKQLEQQFRREFLQEFQELIGIK